MKDVHNPKDIFIGGPMATIMADEIHQQKKTGKHHDSKRSVGQAESFGRKRIHR